MVIGVNMQRRTRVVILGGGFGGLVTARRLVTSSLADRLDISIIDSVSKHVYAPWLYELATSCLTDASTESEWRVAQDSSDFAFAQLRGYEGVRFRKTTIIGVDVENKHVLLEGGLTAPYDILVVALGAVSNYFNIPGLEQLSVSLKSLNDAYQIRRHVLLGLHGRKPGQTLRIVIGGAGPNGTELAAELATTAQAAVRRGLIDEGAMSVVLLDAAPSVLMMLPKRVQQRAEKRLREIGVKLELGKSLSSVDGRHVFVSNNPVHGEASAKPSAVPYDVCVWSGGITMSETVRNLPFEHDPKGRIVVDGALRVVGRDDVYAIGDCAASRNPFTHVPDPQIAQVAVMQGKITAGNIIASLTGKSLNTFPYPKAWSILVTLGGKNACGKVGPFVLSGYVGYLLRRLVDLHYFIEVLSLRDAFAFWRRGVVMYAKNEEGE